jgi:hypothetical protein
MADENDPQWIYDALNTNAKGSSSMYDLISKVNKLLQDMRDDEADVKKMVARIDMNMKGSTADAIAHGLGPVLVNHRSATDTLQNAVNLAGRQADSVDRAKRCGAAGVGDAAGSGDL